MLADARFVQPWRTVLRRVLAGIPDDGAAPGDRIAEHFPSLLDAAARSEGCFALLEAKPLRGEIVPQAVLILNLGQRRADFEEHLKPLQSRLKERLGERLRMVKLEKSWLWTKTNHDKAEYTWGFVGDSFVLYLGDGADQFLAGLRAEAPNALKDSPAFVDSVGKLAGDSMLTTFVDVAKVLALGQSLLKDANDDNLLLLTNNWVKVTGELGLDNARGFGEKTTIEDGQFVTRSLLRTAGPPHGFLATMVQPSVDDAALKAVPPDASWMFAGRLDLSRLYAQVKSAAVVVAGEDGKAAFGTIEDAAAGLGLPVNTLLEPFGDQWVLYEASSTGGLLFTGTTLVVDVRDAEHLNRVIGTLMQLFAGQANGAANVPAVVSSFEVDGVTVQYFPAAGGFFSIVSPAWAVAGKKLVVALYPQVVEDAVKQLTAGKSILDNPRFAETRRRTGGGGPMFYLSGPDLTRAVYPLAMPILSVVRGLGFSEPADRGVPVAELLPSLRRLVQYVGSDGVSMRVTPDGILRTKSVANPLLSPLTLTDSFPLWVAASLPTMGSAKVTADRNRSANNLRQVGQGMLAYASEHEGKFPPDAAALLKSQAQQRQIFQSPFGDGKAESDYKYLVVEGMTNAVPADVVLAYDAAEFEHGDGANVLYADGHVDWMEREGVTSALEKSGKTRAELRK